MGDSHPTVPPLQMTKLISMLKSWVCSLNIIDTTYKRQNIMWKDISQYVLLY